MLLIIDDAVSAEGLPPLIAGLGPQVVTLITTQQGAEIRAEVERWLPADAVMEVGIHGLAPTEGRELVEAVVGRPLTDAEWELVQEIGELVGWHPEALRLAAIEGREIGWQGILGELRAGRMPWIEIRRLVMRQWARLHADQQAWLCCLDRAQGGRYRFHDRRGGNMLEGSDRCRREAAREPGTMWSGGERSRCASSHPAMAYRTGGTSDDDGDSATT